MLRVTPIFGDREDSIQDVVLRCWQSQERIRDLPPYARRAAASRRVDAAWRARRHSQALTDRILGQPRRTAAIPLERLSQADAVRSMLGVVGGLPQGQRVAVEALDLRGEGLVDASARVGRTPGALRSDRWRGRRALEQQLGNGGEK